MTIEAQGNRDEAPMIGRNLIDGQWRSGTNEFETRNPSDLGETVGRYAAATREDAAEACAAARAAQPVWQALNMQAKSDLLRKAGDLILDRKAEIGMLLSREEGKTLAEATGEALFAARCFHYSAGDVLGAQGQCYDSMRDGFSITVMREPVGVIAAITPWNFPIAIPAWKVAAALCHGNAVVLKPSNFAPGCAVLLGQILEQAGLPPGVFNLVLGDAEPATVMIDAADGVSFTGGTHTGRVVLKRAAETMTKVQLELGGKNALVVLDDCDLGLAVDIAANGAWYQTGQRCTATERLIVTRGIHDAFVEKLAGRARELRVGHALDADTQIGPVANLPQFDRNLAFVERAMAEGAELAFGGDRIEGRTRGLFMRPTLLVGTRGDMQCNQTEGFGPVTAVIRVDDLDEALHVANDCPYRLSAAIATGSLSSAERFRKYSSAAMVMVNAPTAGLEYHVPLGARAPSGYGPRENGLASAEFFSELKTAYIHHGVP